VKLRPLLFLMWQAVGPRGEANAQAPIRRREYQAFSPFVTIASGDGFATEPRVR
jgi:hypothetical protein